MLGSIEQITKASRAAYLKITSWTHERVLWICSRIITIYASIKNALVQIFSIFWARIKLVGTAFELAWVLYTPQRNRSVKSQAKAEIKKLQKTNKIYQEFRYSWAYKLTDLLDDHKIGFILFLIIVASITLCISNHAPIEFTLPYCGSFIINPSWLAPGKVTGADGKLIATTGDNFHSIMGTVQATVFSLIIPITVALHEFVVKGKRLKEDMISFIFKEARVRLITASSLGLLIWITFTELLKITYNDFTLSAGSSFVDAVWLIINLALIAYFTFTALNLINRSFFNAAMRRFIVNHIYPRELQGYIERNIFLNQTTKEKENGDD